MADPQLAAPCAEADVKTHDPAAPWHGPHRPMMLREVLRHLDPKPGNVAVDCTLGSGAHAHAILQTIQPNGKLIGIDVDAVELHRTEQRLREAGFDRSAFVGHHQNFVRLPDILAAEGLTAADRILVDLGVSSMQIDDANRGFSYKVPGPLDMRMNPAAGESASQLIARASETELAGILVNNADEPHAGTIAKLIAGSRIATTHLLERTVRMGLNQALPELTKSEVKMAVRRTFQALRIAVNDELNALDELLRVLPHCLTPGGRVVAITFHSGEDRRVKKAFKAGKRSGLYAAVADDVVKSAKDETYTDRRAMAAKLRWAVRA
jgi:16S rRNA (cytosine1402-N4)-methyltransferase